ncbi:MAG: formylglycine-generating enzyme family protein [Gammaproteobacteria bacterium]|nr:formylglycine-generating enzyme family protein [Gammaproteobacteria bacterium]
MSTQFPLRAFLLNLEADGILVRVRDYQRIARALQSGGSWTRRRLRDTLEVLLARNEAQATLLLRRFDRFFSFSTATDETAADEIDTAVFLDALRVMADAPDKPPEPKPVAPAPVPPNNPPHQQRSHSRSLLPWLLLALIFSMGLATWYHWLLPEASPVIETKSLKEPLPPEADKQKTRTYKNVPYVQDIKYVPLPQPKAPWAKNTWSAAGLLLLLIAYLVYLHFNRKIRFPEPLEWDKTKPRRFSLAKVGGKPAPLLDRDTLDEAADAISYFHSAWPAATLDIPASIKATLARGGLPDLRFHRRKRIRTLLILRDKSARASWNGAAEELAAGIQQRGVPVVFGDFKGAPEHFRTAHGSVLHLEDLEESRDAFIILIFSDARRIKHSHAWSDLKQWPQCAWLDYREARLWSPDHPARRYGLPLYAADAPGIRTALKRFLSEQGIRATAIPPVSGELNSAPAVWLGDALPWAQDCALLQPFSPGLADTLRRRFHPHLPATRLQRLLNLPGTQRSAEGLLFAPLTRRLLKQGFLARRSLDQQSEVLRFLRRELDKARPDADDLDWQSRRAMLSLELGEPVPELAALVQTPALNAALSARLQEFGLNGETDKIPLTGKAHAETLETLAWLPDNPLRRTRSRRHPLRTGQRMIIGLFATVFLVMIGLRFFWQVKPPAPPLPPNWTVQGTDFLALLREQPEQDATESSDEFRGRVSTLSDQIRLKPDINYRLTLYGGGYWQELTFKAPKGERVQLTLAQKEFERPCLKEITAGLQAIVCLQDGTAPVRSWRDRLESMYFTAKPKQRQLSVGVELADTADIQQKKFLVYDQLLQFAALDVIYRFYLPNTTDDLVVRRDVPALLERLPVTATQILWWGSNPFTQDLFSEDLAKKTQFTRSVKIDLLTVKHYLRLQKLFQPTEKPYITEAELLAALELNVDAVSGTGDPIVLFRPAIVSLTIKVTPPEARIRVMNIKPKYQPGMKLKSGDYDLEITAPGFKTWREWMTLDKDTELEVVLITNMKAVFAEVDNMLKDIPDELDRIQNNLDKYNARMKQNGKVKEDVSPEKVVAMRDASLQAVASGSTWIEPVTGMEFVKIPGGCFQMGSPKSEKGRYDREKQHEVCVDGFWLARTEVTNAQFRRFKSDHDSKDYGQHSLNGDLQPAVYVSWQDAMKFIEWLNQQNGGRYEFRLPTEAEWEYAARGGTQTAYYWGDEIDVRYLNFSDKNDPFIPAREDLDDGHAVTAPAGNYLPNAFGLYDMLGNVWEWTCSEWDSDYGGDEKRCSSKNHANGRRVLRGGSWGSEPAGARSAVRYNYTPDGRDDNLGFRPARIE